MTTQKYTQLNELLAEHSVLSAHLQEIQAGVNKATLDATHPLLPEHAETKARLSDLEAKLRAIAAENPELFPDDKKTHQTPFGSLSFRTSSKLEFEDEEKTVLKILQTCGKEFVRAAAAASRPRFTVETLLHTHQAPNLEALEKLDDLTLSLFGIIRKVEEKFSVKPLEVKADKLAQKKGKEKVAA